MMRVGDVLSVRVDLSRHAERSGGYLSALPRDPGQDPPAGAWRDEPKEDQR